MARKQSEIRPLGMGEPMVKTYMYVKLMLIIQVIGPC